MKNKTMTNFLYQGIYQLVLIVLPIITVPIVSKTLLPTGLGTYNYSVSIVNYFVLVAGFGLSNYAVREIAYSKSNKIEMSKRFIEIQLLNMLISLIVLLIYFVFCTVSDLKLLFFVQSFSILASIFDISWFFQGIEDFKKISIINVFIKIASFIAIVLLINKPEDIYVYAFINSLSLMISSLSFWIFMKGKIVLIKVKFNSVLSHFFPALNFFVLRISGTIFVNFNKTLLGIFSTMASVGYFTNALTLVTLSGSLINTMNVVMLPKMSLLEKEKDEKKFLLTLSQSLHYQLIFTIPLSFGIIAITPKMIPWFFGTEFMIIKNIIPILAPVVIFQSLHQSIANQYLVPKNKLKSYNFTMFLATIVTCICGIILIPSLEEKGASLSFLIGQIFLALMRSYYLIRETNFKFETKKIFIILIVSTVMYLIINILTKKMAPSIFTTINQVLIGMIFYITVMILLKVVPIKKILGKE
ncbi:oligosaccharide flippase family protein [Enterococcus casseliflavus]|uniref:oligosaccharide flippase family protein n=1 Tax=Enterococcus casseliflavus TaxID=37734 RepID=UPI0039FBE2D4